MLRSATKISIQAKTFQNYDGMMVSPIIEIEGLILRSDHPIPLKIKQFIEAKGGVVKRVTIDNEMFVKLSGEFNITKFEIYEFINQNFELVAQQLINLESLPKSLRLISKLSAKFDAHQQLPGTLRYTDGSTVVNVTRSSISTGGDNNLQCSYEFSNSASIYSGGCINLSAFKMTTSGIAFPHFKRQRELTITTDGVARQIPIDSGMSTSEGPEVGIMSEMLSLGDTNISTERYTNISDSVISSAGMLNLNTGNIGNLCLNINKTREWLNNPFPGEFYQYLEHRPGTITQLLDAEVVEEFSSTTPTGSTLRL